MAYIPLSIQQPSQFALQKVKQALCAENQAWWPCRDSLLDKATEHNVLLGPCGTSEQPDTDVQDEISAAIETPLTSVVRTAPPPQPAHHPNVKTSETHPINVSSIIPFELLPIISAHLTTPPKGSPVLYDVPPIYTLDRISSTPQVPHRSISAHIPPSPEAANYFPHIRARVLVSDALQAAINSSLAASGNAMPAAKGLSSTSWTGIPPPISIERTSSAPPVPYSNMIPNESKKISSALDSLKRKTPMPATIPIEPLPKPSLLIGNLLLSSCPGKKVRLDGPVKGRSTVCRDLATDLMRMRVLGVRCVICCLDDEELEYLGASWAQYAQAAKHLGLDVLRIPTPEGFAPLTPRLLDAHLSRVIENYTLRGIPVLVHCRGGVGRAGLVACCWALKLGLCGWIETGNCPAPGLVRRDTFQLVERMVTTVRRRRSIKAVETYEQVKFLVEFVDFLRDRAKEGSVDASAH